MYVGHSSSPMNSLLETLRTEVLELRAQSDLLTRQMWLLYVTFEDVICLEHPHRQRALLASTIDIDNFIARPQQLLTRLRGSGGDRTRGKRVIRSEQQSLKLSAGGGSCPSRSSDCVDCRCATRQHQQSSGRFCVDKQQIDSEKVLAVDIRAISLSYKGVSVHNDQSGCQRGCYSVDCPISLPHVQPTESSLRTGQFEGTGKVGKGQSVKLLPQHGRKTNELACDWSINEPLSSRGADHRVDKAKLALHLGLMRSDSREHTGQFVPGSSLVSAPKLPGSSDHGPVPRGLRRGFEAMAEVLSCHTFPSGTSEMGVRSDFYASRYPGSDYCLAKAVPGHGVTLVSQPAFPQSHSHSASSRRHSEGSSVLRPEGYLRQAAPVRPVRKHDLSRGSQPGQSRQMCTRQEYWTDRADRRSRMEFSSARKYSPLADDTQLSPVTISSGYESDSIPSPVQPDLGKSGVVCTDDDHTDYFSQSDTYPKSQDIQTSRERVGLLPLEVRSKQTPFVPTLTKSRFVRFGQHHNATLSPCQASKSQTNCHKQGHKFAKVTRSMYAIIHDLQDENARRKMRRHSCDALQEKHDCGWTGGRQDGGRMSLSPIVSPELRSRADVFTTQSESGDQDHVQLSSPESISEDTPARPVPLGSSVSASDTYSQIRKKQCAMSSVTQRLFHVDIKHQSVAEDDISKPADQQDDNSQTERVRRESLKPRYKYNKGSEAQSDNEHIYEVIPGDEGMINSLGIVQCEKNKLAKWSTVRNLDSETPPALPERKYHGKKNMEPPIPPRCSLKEPTFSVTSPQISASQCRKVEMVCDNDNQDYAVVMKVKPTLDNRSLDGCLDRLDEEAGSDLDSELYSRVCPPQPRQRNTFDFSDLTSETYCRLDPTKRVLDIDEWSPGDMLNFIDGIHEQHTPKTRDNIYCLLQNSKTRAKFCESLEIETRLLHKGLLCTSWESDEVTDTMTSGRFQCDFRQEIQPTYV